MSPRRALGRYLRRLADRIDYHGAPKAFATLTYGQDGYEVDTDGIKVGEGCVLYYMGDDESERVHEEARRRHRRIDWRTGEVWEVGLGEPSTYVGSLRDTSRRKARK